MGSKFKLNSGLAVVGEENSISLFPDLVLEIDSHGVIIKK